jgi:hypothetical protein
LRLGLRTVCDKERGGTDCRSRELTFNEQVVSHTVFFLWFSLMVALEVLCAPVREESSHFNRGSAFILFQKRNRKKVTGNTGEGVGFPRSEG